MKYAIAKRANPPNTMRPLFVASGLLRSHCFVAFSAFVLLSLTPSVGLTVGATVSTAAAENFRFPML